MQHLNLLWYEVVGQDIHARNIAAWTVKARHEAGLNRVDAAGENNWNGRGRCLSRLCGGKIVSCCNYTHIATNQVSGQIRQLTEVVFSPTIFNRHIAVLHITRFTETPAKCAN